MKTTFHILALICLVPMLVACGKGGKSDDQVAAATPGVAAANTCTNGQVYSPQYGCAPAQYGNPGGYNGGQGWQPVNNVQVPNTGCQPGYYQYPYGGGYGQYGCQQQRSYRWFYYGGYYYFY